VPENVLRIHCRRDVCEKLTAAIQSGVRTRDYWKTSRSLCPSSTRPQAFGAIVGAADRAPQLEYKARISRG
jgi:hypothetical protein